MSPNKKHDDSKILLAVAGAVVAGAAGLALLAGLAGEVTEVPGAPVARTMPATNVDATVDETAATPAVFVETREFVGPIMDASLEKVGGSTVTPEITAAVLDEVEDETEPFEIKPGEDLVAGGLAAWNSADYDRASAYFSAQIAARDSDAWAHYMLGLSQWRAGSADEAVVAMRRSAELDPAFIRTPINLSRIENDRGDYEAALAAAQDALLIDGDDAEARFLEGRAWNNLGRTDAAVVALERSIELSDANGYAYNLLGLVRLEQGDAERAADALEHAVRLEPNVAFIHNNLGMALEHCGDLETAAVVYRRAVELDGGAGKAASNLARLQPATPESTGETVAVVTVPEKIEEIAEPEVIETADSGIQN